MHIMVQSNTSLVCFNQFQERKKGPGTNESADGEEHHWPCKSHFDVPASTSPSLTTLYYIYIYVCDNFVDKSSLLSSLSGDFCSVDRQ